MSRKSYTPAEKSQILERVSEIGATAAAKEAGVSYQTVLKWVNGRVNKVTALPVKKMVSDIEAKEEEIRDLEESLKLRKAELKAMQKAKTNADKENERLEKAKKNLELIEALMKTGRSAEEILEFLNR